MDIRKGRQKNITDEDAPRKRPVPHIVLHLTAPSERKGDALRADLMGAANDMPVPLSEALEIRARSIGHLPRGSSSVVGLGVSLTFM